MTRIYAFLACLVAGLSFPAQAFNLDKSFSDLTDGAVVAYNESGVYSNSARHAIILGGVDARLPRKRATLMSVTPPVLNAGCQGISAHFGGLTFISGQQIEAMINTIAANSTGVVINLVIKTLCPICQGVIEAMQHMAQQAAKMAIDSCGVANNLVAQAESFLGTGAQTQGDADGTVCGRKLSGMGKYASYLEAMDEACNTMNKAVAALEQISKSRRPAATDAKGNPVASGDVQIDKLGNPTWEILKHAGFGGNDKETIFRRTVMLNLLGTKVKASANEDGTPRDPPYVTYPRTLTPVLLMDLYMCGTQESVNASISSAGMSAKYRTPNVLCASAHQKGLRDAANNAANAAGGEISIWVCDEPDKCLHPKLTPVNELTGWFEGEGFIYRVSRLLQQAAENVRQNRGFDDNPEILSLLSSVPFPVYQIVNAAAVYPMAANDLIDVTSGVIAETMAEQVLEDFIRGSVNAVSSNYFSQQDLQEVMAMMEGFTASITQRKTFIANRVAAQEMLMENIRTVNLAIQKEVLSGELLGSSQWSGAVTSSVAEANR